jgi:hypothetical protein
MSDEKSVERYAAMDRNKFLHRACIIYRQKDTSLITKGDLKVRIRAGELDFRDPTPEFFLKSRAPGIARGLL